MKMKTFQQFQEESGTIGSVNDFQGKQLKTLEKGLDRVKNSIPGLKDSKDIQADRENDREERTKDMREKDAALAAQRESDRREDRRRKEELHQAKLDKLKQTNEVYDPEVQGRSQIRKTGEGGRVGRDRRKSEPERRRMKAVGGGESKPVSYKDRKDIGGQKQSSTRVQQPEKARDDKKVKQTYADKIKAERRAAALARRKTKESGGEVKKEKISSKDTEKQASKLLSKKTPEKKVSPDYKPQKASGYTRKERMSITRKGETKLRGIMKQQEMDKYKKETGVNPDAKGRSKVMARVHSRMSS